MNNAWFFEISNYDGTETLRAESPGGTVYEVKGNDLNSVEGRRLLKAMSADLIVRNPPEPIAVVTEADHYSASAAIKWTMNPLPVGTELYEKPFFVHQRAPIDMLLFCPVCGLQHIDKPDEDTHTASDGTETRWDNPPHRSHLCHGCGHIWRPADVATNGVAAIKTRGKADHPITPSSRWSATGESDPFGRQYDCERAKLAMGHLTDDELANGAFMNYDVRPSLQDIIDRKANSPIAWMTAVKDRIRWLSRALERAKGGRTDE